MKYQVSLHTKHHIFIHEDNMLSAHIKDHCRYVTYKNCSLWNDLVFHWHLYNKRNITQLPGDMKFLFMLKNPHTSTYVLKSSPHHSFDTAKMNLKKSFLIKGKRFRALCAIKSARGNLTCAWLFREPKR